MQNKKFFSETYQRFLHFRMTASVIKEVKRLGGGIDEYLRSTPNDDLLYPKAIQIKRNLLRIGRLQERSAALAEQAGGGGGSGGGSGGTAL